jgi:hypothetical protein
MVMSNNDTGRPESRDAAPGIVIRDRIEPPKRPLVTAFIWGGKVRPVPALPYGRHRN